MKLFLFLVYSFSYLASAQTQSIQIPESQLSPHATITVNWSGISNQNEAWVGIYKHQETEDLKSISALRWYYLNGKKSIPSNVERSGSLELKGLKKGKYDVYFFNGNDYTLLDGPHSIVVGKTFEVASLKVSKKSFKTNEPLKFSFSSPANEGEDWLGLYHLDDTPGHGSPSLTWSYTNGRQTSAGEAITKGSLKFRNSLEPGDYVARFFKGGKYELLSEPVFFSVIQTAEQSSDLYDPGSADIALPSVKEKEACKKGGSLISLGGITLHFKL